MKVPTLNGITFVTRDKGGFTLALDRPTRADFKALLHWLPEGWEVDFHDPYYPQLSDPGAYVLIQRRAERFLYRLGNHGWLNRWTHQSPDLLAAYLQLVADYPGERTSFDGPIMVKPAYRSAWDDRDAN